MLLLTTLSSSPGASLTGFAGFDLRLGLCITVCNNMENVQWPQE